MSEARAKSAVVGIDSKSKGASSDPSYEAITQQIAYLMSAITNQNKNNISVGHNNGNGKIPNMKVKGLRKIEKIGFVGDVEVLDMGGGNVEHLDQAIISLLNQKPPALSQHQPGRSQHQQTTKKSWGACGTEVPQS